jgi:hypothetical protein
VEPLAVDDHFRRSFCSNSSRVCRQGSTQYQGPANESETNNEEQIMKVSKLNIIIPFAAALTFGQAFAQGNPHMEMTGESQKVALFQGNPHFNFEAGNSSLASYRGNPHEGYIVKMEHIAATQGNPQAGFRMVQLEIASAE